MVRTPSKAELSDAAARQAMHTQWLQDEVESLRREKALLQSLLEQEVRRMRMAVDLG